MMKLSINLFLPLILLMPHPSNAAEGGTYTCTTYPDQYKSSKFFTVSEATEGSDLNFTCRIGKAESGKKVLDCRENVTQYGDQKNSPPLLATVDFGSDLNVSGNASQVVDPWKGTIWPRYTSLTCIFKK